MQKAAFSLKKVKTFLSQRVRVQTQLSLQDFLERIRDHQKAKKVLH